jgi:hypothetical protein
MFRLSCPSVNHRNNIVEDCTHRFTKRPSINCCDKSPTQKSAIVGTQAALSLIVLLSLAVEMVFLHLCAKNLPLLVVMRCQEFYCFRRNETRG